MNGSTGWRRPGGFGSVQGFIANFTGGLQGGSGSVVEFLRRAEDPPRGVAFNLVDESAVSFDCGDDIGGEPVWFGQGIIR